MCPDDVEHSFMSVWCTLIPFDELQKFAGYEEDLEKINEAYEKYLSAVLHKNNIKDVNEYKIDSLKTAFKMMKKSDKENISLDDEILKTRKETKHKFEEMVKDKYNFRFVTENFSVAIAEAEKKKEIQIAEQSQRNE